MLFDRYFAVHSCVIVLVKWIQIEVVYHLHVVWDGVRRSRTISNMQAAVLSFVGGFSGLRLLRVGFISLSLITIVMFCYGRFFINFTPQSSVVSFFLGENGSSSAESLAHLQIDDAIRNAIFPTDESTLNLFNSAKIRTIAQLKMMAAYGMMPLKKNRTAKVSFFVTIILLITNSYLYNLSRQIGRLREMFIWHKLLDWFRVGEINTKCIPCIPGMPWYHISGNNVYVKSKMSEIPIAIGIDVSD